MRVGGLRRPVVQARADAAHRSRDELCRAGALAAVPAHVAHLAGETCPQPIEKARLIRREIDVRHADAGKAELCGPAADVGEQGGGIERCGARVQRGFAYGCSTHAGKATRSDPIKVNIPSISLKRALGRMAVFDVELALPDAAATRDPRRRPSLEHSPAPRSRARRCIWRAIWVRAKPLAYARCCAPAA